MKNTRLVIGITGTTGLVYGVRLLEVLRDTGVETHLVTCECARRALAAETGRDADTVGRLAARVYDEANLAARISSGSFLTDGMIIAPCSTRSLSAIAIGLATNLVHRAADVTLKEGRTLVLGVPESTRSAIDLDTMARLALVPGVAIRPLPSLTEGPQGGMGAIDQAVGELLEPFGIEQDFARG